MNNIRFHKSLGMIIPQYSECEKSITVASMKHYLFENK